LNVLSGLAPKLSQASAALLIDDLLAAPAHELRIEYDRNLLIQTLGLLASRQDPVQAARIARAILEWMSFEDNYQYRAEMLIALSRSAFGLPESELAALSTLLMASLFDADGGGFLTPAELSAAMGGDLPGLGGISKQQEAGHQVHGRRGEFPNRR
jgi:hypothetical protein